MTEIRSGIRQVLSSPYVYDLFQGLTGAYAWRRRVVNTLVAPAIPEGGVVVDVGCGTAKILNYLPATVEYIGFDQSLHYLQAARKRFPERKSRFYCEELTPRFKMDGRRADAVLAFGILHHLDDATAKRLFQAVLNVLVPGGSLFTLDPLYLEGQSSFAKFIISRDRGTAVRTESAYRELALESFSTVETFIDTDPIWIPYSGIVMKCTAPLQEAIHV